MQHTHSAQKRAYGFWNWGTGIAIAIIAGAIAMLFLVYKSMGVHYDMAEEDYYAAELKQNDKITAIQNANKLSAALKVDIAEGAIVLQFPPELVTAKPEGTVKFYRPSDISLDMLIPVQLDDQARMVIPDDKLQTGNYRLQISWNMDGKDFYVERSFYMP